MRRTTAGDANPRQLQASQTPRTQRQPLRDWSTDLGSHRHHSRPSHSRTRHPMGHILGNATRAPRRLDHRLLSCEDLPDTKAAPVTQTTPFPLFPHEETLDFQSLFEAKERPKDQGPRPTTEPTKNLGTILHFCFRFSAERAIFTGKKVLGSPA